MTEKDILNEFIAFAYSTEFFHYRKDSNDGNNLWFSFPFCESKLILSGTSFYDSESVNVADDFKVVAIVKENSIYIFNMLLITGKAQLEELPPNVFHVNFEFCKKLFNTLNVEKAYVDLNEDFGSSSKRDLQDVARHFMIFEEDPFAAVDKAEKHDLYSQLRLNKQDIANDLLGTRSIRNTLQKNFETNKDYLRDIKITYAEVRKICLQKDLVKPFERKMGQTLMTCKAQNVNVTFSINGNTATSKVSMTDLKYALVHERPFRVFAFKNMGALLQQLKAKPEELTCRNISKISYNRKVLYEKNN